MQLLYMPKKYLVVCDLLSAWDEQNEVLNELHTFRLRVLLLVVVVPIPVAVVLVVMRWRRRQPTNWLTLYCCLWCDC